MKALALFLPLIWGCPFSQSAPEPIFNLAVASSLGPAAIHLSSELRKSHGLNIRVQSGASSLIARQIAGGLPCDVIILADNEWMDFLSNQKIIEPSTRRPFLKNRLVWIANKIPNKHVEKGRIAMADAEHVPAGKYAKAALLYSGDWAKIAPHVISAPDARTALLWVEQGEADQGIVYESDALSSNRVKITSYIEASAKRPILYPIAQCRSRNKLAKNLYRILTQSKEIEIFRRFGFRIVDPVHEPA